MLYVDNKHMWFCTKGSTLWYEVWFYIFSSIKSVLMKKMKTKVTDSDRKKKSMKDAHPTKDFAI